MSIRAYVPQGYDRQLWPPLHSHEASGAVAMIQRLHQAFAAERDEYAVVVNLQRPKADLIVLTPLGVGVVELKHYAGVLSVRGEGWFADDRPVKAGSEESGHANPRAQVQSYAAQLRQSLARRCAAWWGLTEHNLAKVLRVQTAVCFTNPGLHIPAEARAAITRAAEADYSRMGRFDLLTPQEFPAWAAALRFEVVENAAHQHRPYRLSPQHMAELIEGFQGVEWSAVTTLMPTDLAYAYLVAQHQGEQQTFPLHVLDTGIGRSASHCAVTIPRGYGMVSRVHAQISRYGAQVWLQDRQSSHGTYVNGVRVGQAVMLRAGDRITLGGPYPGDGVYACTYLERLADDQLATETARE